MVTSCVVMKWWIGYLKMFCNEMMTYHAKNIYCLTSLSNYFDLKMFLIKVQNTYSHFCVKTFLNKVPSQISPLSILAILILIQSSVSV